MAGFSFKQVNTLILWAALWLFSPICLAEVRVIVEYDSTEHRLVRVVEVPSGRSAPISDHLGSETKTANTPQDAISKVKLFWFNANSELISTAYMDDPRLIHAPLSGDDQAPTVVGVKAGAFMVSGPSDSAVLEIHMPVNPVLGLDQQVWRMLLDDY